MSKRRVSRFVLFGGVATAMTAAALGGGGCSSSGNNTPPGSTSTGTGSSSTGTGTSTGSSTSSATSTSSSTGTSTSSSTSTSSASVCNTALELLGDAGGTLVFSFDDGGTTESLGATGSWSVTALDDPADAGFDVGIQGNTTVGNTCPGSLELTIPLTNLSQSASIAFSYPSPPGVPITATAMHVAFKLAFVDAADASAAQAELIGGNDAEAFSFLQAFAQWAYPNPLDGGAPDAAYQNKDYAGPSAGFGAFPTDGGWVLATVPILQTDGAATTTPMTIYLNQIGVQVGGPGSLDGAAAPLAFPLTLQLFVDDIYFQ